MNRPNSTFRQPSLEEVREKQAEKRNLAFAAPRNGDSGEQGNPSTSRLRLVRGGKAAKRRGIRRSVKIDPADRFFSLFIRYRANWQCERCMGQYPVGAQGLHCSHFWGRARESTRFDPDNASAHCHGCHSFFTANPELHRQWKLKQIGQAAYDRLMVRAEIRQKKDRKLMAILCKKLYEEEKARFESQRLLRLDTN